MKIPIQAARTIESHSSPLISAAVDSLRSVSLVDTRPNLLQSIVDQLPDGVVVAGVGGALLFSNAAARNIIGPGTEAAAAWASGAGCYLDEGVTPCPAEKFPLYRALEGQSCEEFELFVRNAHRPDGVWISASAGPWRNAEGGLLGAVAVIRDVTETNRSKQVLELLWGTLHHTTDAVLMTDGSGSITYVNPAFELTTGYASEEAVGATPRILKSGVHDEAFYDDMWRSLRSGDVFKGVLVNRRKNGEHFHAEQTITPVRGADGTCSHFVSIMRDITEPRAALERETELHLARDVQQHLYPRAVAVPGYDIAAAIHPEGAMCGDYFDSFPMKGGAFGVALGDVSGHGIASAMIMVGARAYVRSLANTDAGVHELMTQLNEALVGDLDAQSFMTLVLIRLEAASGRFTYANAGHLTGYVLDSSARVREELPSTGLLLGCIARQQYGPFRELMLGPGETLLVFTDGIAESESPLGEEFGADRAVAAAAQSLALPASQIAQNVYRSARTFSADAPQVDDMTVFVCKRDA